MAIELALALAIRQTNPKVDHARADKYAAWVVEEADKRALDPWLFQAIIYTESRWTARVVRVEGDGSCSVGLGQINLARCEKDKIEELKEPQTNLQRMGEFLERIRSTCRYKCDGLGWLRAYNPGSKKYVPAVAAALERYHARFDEQSSRRALRVDVHASGMCWDLDPRDGDHCWSPRGFDGPA